MRGRAFAEAAVLLALYEVGFSILGARVLPLFASPRAAAIGSALIALLFASAIVAVVNGFSLRPRDLPSRAIGWKRSVAPIGLALTVLGAAALALRLADPRFDDVEFARNGLGSPATFWTLAAAVPFLVASEEILFRACQERLRRALGGAAAIAIVGVAFGAHHVGPDWATRHGAESLVATLAGGLILAALYEMIASVPLLIAVHVVYDALALGQAWLNVNRRRWMEGALFAVWILGSAAIARRAGRGRR